MSQDNGGLRVVTLYTLPSPHLSLTGSYHFRHLEAQFLMCCGQHGQSSSCCVLQFVVILPTEQHHQLKTVIPISQEPLLNLFQVDV